MPKAAGKWNTYEITAQGLHLVVVLNGQKTVDVQDLKACWRVRQRFNMARAGQISARCRSSRCRQDRVPGRGAALERCTAIQRSQAKPALGLDPRVDAGPRREDASKQEPARGLVLIPIRTVRP